MNYASDEDSILAPLVLLAIASAVLFVGTGAVCWGIPQYKVYCRTQEGVAELQQAESNRKIITLEAQAKHESAKALAAAEVERAKGVAEANRIIGDSLSGNESYLHYLWIQSLDNSGHVIYVPTEANLPIMEASRLKMVEQAEFNKKVMQPE